MRTRYCAKYWKRARQKTQYLPQITAVAKAREAETIVKSKWHCSGQPASLANKLLQCQAGHQAAKDKFHFLIYSSRQ